MAPNRGNLGLLNILSYIKSQISLFGANLAQFGQESDIPVITLQGTEKYNFVRRIIRFFLNSENINYLLLKKRDMTHYVGMLIGHNVTLC